MLGYSKKNWTHKKQKVLMCWIVSVKGTLHEIAPEKMMVGRPSPVLLRLIHFGEGIFPEANGV